MERNSQIVHDIAAYISATKKTMLSYSLGEQHSMTAFLDRLEKSDLLQAELVIQGYLLCGGNALQDVLPAARAIQMTHTYAEMLSDKEQAVAAASGLHAAEVILANLALEEGLRLKVVSITNRALLLYMHAAASDQDTDYAQHCYATELTLNPLHVGMVLAGADCAATDAITAFALAWGRALRTPQETSYEEVDVAFESLIMWQKDQIQSLRELYQATLAL